MQHHKAVVPIVVVSYAVRDVRPSGGRHITRVDGRRELKRVDFRVKLLQFGHILQQVLEVEGLQRLGLRISYHADGAAGIDK